MTTQIAILASITILATALSLRANAGYTDASWYGHELKGKLMANKQPFDPDAFTCASWDYPLGTWLKVTADKRSVYVQVTDRGPAKRLAAKGRRLDLSIGAWKKLGLDPEIGVARVRIVKDSA